MSYKPHHRDGKSSSSHNHKSNRQAFNKSSNAFNGPRKNFDFRLYDHDREDRINALVDDDDGDLNLQRQSQSTTTIEKPSRTIEANDRRHDAVIFGDKTVEEQQKNQLWDSYKQSSKYSTTSLAGPLLLEDVQSKRLRWKEKLREQWLRLQNIQPTKFSTEMETE